MISGGDGVMLADSQRGYASCGREVKGRMGVGEKRENLVLEVSWGVNGLARSENVVDEEANTQI